jgi:tetratricopeptide (TPR) repeat protein
LSAADRQRLQQVFLRAKKCLERADYAYAHDLFSQCVSEDPGSLIYLQHFRANLAQMHPKTAAAKHSAFSGLPGFGGGRAVVAKAASKGEWREAFAAGCKTLKKSPGDVGTIAELGDAAGELGHTDCQLYYLRWALDLSPQDLDVNRQAAAALEAIGEFDQAIGCWLRVQQQKPGDEQASRAISRLSVEKTIDRGGYNPQLLKGAGEVSMPHPARVAEASARRKYDSPDPETEDKPVDAAKPPQRSEDELRAAINANPADPDPYVQLAEMYATAGRLHDAERLYKKALQVAGGGDLELLEKLEEVYLNRKRDTAQVAAQRAERQQSPAAQKLAEQAQREANLAEVEVFGARAERTPGDPRVQYEFGVRLKRVGNYREAVKPFQAARTDKKRTAEAELHLGECFQHIQQHRLAMRSYEAAIAACLEGDWTDLRKLAHYRAGVLAMGLRDLDAAEKYLTDLASADFGYRDVSERLDKLAAIRKTH